VGTAAVSAARTIELLRDFDPDHIGAIFDVPNMIRVGLEDSRMGLELLGPHLVHGHIGNGTPEAGARDGQGALQWSWVFSRLKEGVANIAQIIGDLKSVGYKGYISLEDFSPARDEDKLRDQGVYLQTLIRQESKTNC
jgi:sugar phosphate isomerase/epimerase